MPVNPSPLLSTSVEFVVQSAYLATVLCLAALLFIHNLIRSCLTFVSFLTSRDSVFEHSSSLNFFLCIVSFFVLVVRFKHCVAQPSSISGKSHAWFVFFG